MLDAARVRKDRPTAPPVLLTLNYFFNPNVKITILPDSWSGFVGDTGRGVGRMGWSSHEGWGRRQLGGSARGLGKSAWAEKLIRK